MGQLVTTVVGGIAGFMIGGPMGAQIGMMLGGMIGATLFGPTVHGPRLNDLKVAASTYGVAIPEIYGTVRIGGNMIWTSGIKETKKTQRAGKGGPKQTTYTYDATFAMGLCKGPIEDITRIWADSKLIYDGTNGSARSPIANGSGFFSIFAAIIGQVISKKKKLKNLNIRVYKGTEDQVPDSLIVANKGAGNVSAHRGMAYVVFEKLQLEDFGNRIPQLTFEVTKAPNTSIGTLPANDGTDATNQANVQWIADFETGRLLGMTSGAAVTKTYDISSMSEIVDSDLDIDFAGRALDYIPGSNLLVCGNPPGLAKGFAYYNIATLTLVSSHQSLGGATSSYDVDNDLTILSETGTLGHGRFISGSTAGHHLAHSDPAGTVSLMTSDGGLINQFAAPFVPEQFIEGTRSYNTSQIIGARAAADRLEMFVISTPATATHELLVEGAESVWVPFKDYTVTTTNLQPYPGEVFIPYTLVFDLTDEHLFCLGTSNGVVTAFKYSLATASYKFLAKYPTLVLPGDTIKRMVSSQIQGGTFGWIGTPAGEVPSFIQIDLQNGALQKNIAIDDPFVDTITTTGQQMWDDETNSVLVERTGTGGIEFNRVFVGTGVTQISVRAIVEDVCLRSGVLIETDLDLDELNDDPITGYTIDRQTTARDALKQMATGYLFDAYESDYKLKFRSRGGDTDVVIPQSWIARDEDNNGVQENLTQELEMPLRIGVNYYDITRDHQQGTQSAKRKANPFPTMWTAKEDTIDLPIVWNPTEAKRCADKILKMAWANRTGFQLNLPWRYLKYDPTDIASVEMESGTTYTIRLTEANIGADFTIQAKGVSEDATAYVSDATGNAGIAPEQTVPGGDTAFPIVINTPLLRDSDYDTNGLSLCYVSAGTNGTRFGGTTVYMEDGTEYRGIATVSADATSGYTLEALPPTLAYEATDENTIIRVRLSDPSMELESVTQDDMLNFEANAALIGNEVIQFREAVQQTNGEWWLTGILRARRGTNYAVRDHTAGERFLLLDTIAVGSFYRPPESYVTTRNFKAAAAGELLSDLVPVPADLIPRDLMPYTPIVKFGDDGTTATLYTLRRSRIYAGLNDLSASIHYREGDMISARLDYKVWAGLDLADVGTLADPTISGSISIFDSSGNELTTNATFPLASLGGATKLLVRVVEMGEVEGIPTWVAYENAGGSNWNRSDYY